MIYKSKYYIFYLFMAKTFRCKNSYKPVRYRNFGAHRTVPYFNLLLCVLGPHIAAVTLAAYECQSTDFPQPPYPDSIVCPDSPAGVGMGVSIWDILSKVRVEAFCWGAGTAIGELPPYFMARAARLSGNALQCCGSEIRCLFDLRIRDEQPGSYFRELGNYFCGEILQFLDADPGWKKFVSGINIPDPQHCRTLLMLYRYVRCSTTRSSLSHIQLFAG
jgi:hypothetical protein